MIKITNEDNMKLMSRYDDKHFDIAIVDPPYGILSKFGDRLDKYGQEFRKWDSEPPPQEYWTELMRVSKNQIVFGANNFAFLWDINSKSFFFWDKKQPIKGWARGELAWTSFDTNAKYYGQNYFGGVGQDPNRFHPTQKSVEVYEFCLMEYAEKGNTILDTHLGSGSIALACHNLGYNLTACEIEPRYFEQAVQRLEYHKQQLRMFF
jgi:site-specific DNA-methyltransferase (adenine-specific)